MTGRSAAAKKRRAPARARAIASGTRVACPRCKVMHAPPACDVDAENFDVLVSLPPYLAAVFKERVAWGERSPWVARLIRNELGL